MIAALYAAVPCSAGTLRVAFIPAVEDGKPVALGVVSPGWIDDAQGGYRMTHSATLSTITDEGLEASILAAAQAMPG